MKTPKTALITGITGQDGSYLAELLLEKGYRVYGLQRRTSTFNTVRIDHLYDNPKYPTFTTVYGDLSDGSNLSRLLEKIKPDEIYNLGAQSHVGVSFQIPEYTANVTGLGALRLLDAIKDSGIKTKFYQASSSEMFGKVLEVPQKETTPFNPQSPYGVSKTLAYWMTKVHRNAYGLFASNGILFNHESPRRGETFVTRKITIGLSRVKLGLQDILSLGNLDAKRDWGYAKDYVEAIWRILQHKEPDDFLIATGETHTVREFVEEVGNNLGYNIIWRGKSVNEKGYDKKTGKLLVCVDKVLFRPSEVDLLIGDASKAKKILGWKPKVTFKKLAQLMTEHDFGNVKNRLNNKKVKVNRM
ncbi:MAG: GDP-mannose 4,6-dehydratase [Candidatus Yanofskybacteria bacterium RIFCSPLOWO2_12_FULL_43_11b]|uniref:GDP-mannose 4,6-dehydratase n=1 Tax=Candidatus Yanofskybacteria bacterium RIFCSPLOWO2_12_FULL_43_11b TaxID=1802710 RepID=A0A1F8H8R8_9BACT|nr:MAG: GDP-mannose 4,6-dehydratase [Candidatus Yanofskybacteria bacterium RIFCSPHIGHO2_01_FULL_43_32]OGN10962.1 MAG: GDP-mannose 4,6-dehydratase [Candidatus Yanofskybacteria bacterium RIFCSPHIGHO2_02_FULL_43_12]OGN17110.1 MAG: GDP-mannose 4,6-dehydratase [Candidatus Yanofskybacteria bacterium RIFCSPHIGHO2_12_FULL_43_11]OGN24090.1 MAG: GDP-mannose 4,6-dehydratase [Candidatus Yanofskybacteria bacterium RIFCSPLOWO2_01_FULL_43_46]OGN33580.1 MAG: GDP-mannose 4,6-dehydratase [Candidatus Yanofskybact